MVYHSHILETFLFACGTPIGLLLLVVPTQFHLPYFSTFSGARTYFQDPFYLL